MKQPEPGRQRRDIWRAEPAGGRASRVSRGAGATGAGRGERTRGGSSPTLQRLLLTGVADSSCPEQETGASRPRADALGRREACCWGCSSAGGDTRPFSGGTQRQRRRRRPQRSGRGPDLPSARGCSRSLQAPPAPPPRRAGAPPKPRRPPLLGPLPGPAAPGIAAPPSPPASGLVRPPPLRPRRWRRRRPRRSSPRPPRLPERPAPSLRSASLPPAPPPVPRAPPPTRPLPLKPATAGGAHARTRTDTQRANRRGGSAPLARPLAVSHAAAHSVPSPTPSSNQSGNGSEGEREVSLPARPFSPLNGCVSRQSQSDLSPPPLWSSAQARGGGRGRAGEGGGEDKTHRSQPRAHPPAGCARTCLPEAPLSPQGFLLA